MVLPDMAHTTKVRPTGPRRRIEAIKLQTGSDRRTVRMIYALRKPDVRDEFLRLMTELRTVTRLLMRSADAADGEYSMSEIAGRPDCFEEIIHFKSEKERNKFDDLYCEDRTASAIQALLDELLDGSRSDFTVVSGSGH
jgi:hypothetical protein